jgi:hypothetical protein
MSPVVNVLTVDGLVSVTRLLLNMPDRVGSSTYSMDMTEDTIDTTSAPIAL